MDANVGMDPESIEILRNSARVFRGKAAPEMTYKAWEAVVGSWIKDAEAAKLKDPTLDSAIFAQTTSVLMWCGLGCVYPCLPSRAEHYGAEGVDVNGRRTGLETGDPRKFKSFDELYDDLMKQHRFITHLSFWLAAIARKEQSKHVRLPFLSTMGIQQCMDLGQDLLIPDPDSCMFGISDRAIVDVADSLTAVKKLVFDDKKLTMDELLKVLDSNFDGKRGEEVRQMSLAQPKFGNDMDEVDLLAKKISEDSYQIIRSYDNSPFRNYMIAREGLAWHYFGGLGVGALPNGRKAFEPLNDGAVSPMRGADKKGPTAVLRSALKAGFKESHASVLNQKFSAAILGSNESIDKLVTYTHAFMSNGGSHWMPYAHVQDVEATANKAEKLGAKIMLGKTEVMGMGWLAIITDPQGAMFGFWQAKG